MTADYQSKPVLYKRIIKKNLKVILHLGRTSPLLTDGVQPPSFSATWFLHLILLNVSSGFTTIRVSSLSDSKHN